MKRGISVLLTAILMISLAACGGDENRKIVQRYGDLKSYTARIRLTVAGNRGTGEYVLSQSYRPEDSYRTEVVEPERMAGTVWVIHQGEIWFRDGNAPAILMDGSEVREQQSILSLADFCRRAFSEDTIADVVPQEDGTVMIPSVCSGGTRQHFSQCLWIDRRSNLPIALVTYDHKGNETVRVTYEDFVPEAPLEESVFLP